MDPRYPAEIAGIVARQIILFIPFPLQDQVLTSCSICSLLPFDL
jgi:hypothetical protein